MINSPTGKWGFNPNKQRATRVVTDSSEFYHYLLGKHDRCNINIINEDVAVVNVAEHDEFSAHTGSNVYIACYITSYARVKLYREALIPCGRNVLYFDTDSVMYVSPNGQPIIPIDTTKTLGLWTDEAPAGDFFTEFVSSGPKSYALKTFNGLYIEKSKGFYLHHNNALIYHFDALEKQVIARCRGEHVDDLVLHKDEMKMDRNLFQIVVRKDKGKRMRMPYDKRLILSPCDLYPKFIDTLPLGHTQNFLQCLVNEKIKATYAVFARTRWPDHVKQKIVEYIFYKRTHLGNLLYT
jgi:hypothetical protein